MFLVALQAKTTTPNKNPNQLDFFARAATSFFCLSLAQHGTKPRHIASHWKAREGSRPTIRPSPARAAVFFFFLLFVCCSLSFFIFSLPFSVAPPPFLSFFFLLFLLLLFCLLLVDWGVGVREKEREAAIIKQVSTQKLGGLRLSHVRLQLKQTTASLSSQLSFPSLAQLLFSLGFSHSLLFLSFALLPACLLSVSSLSPFYNHFPKQQVRHFSSLFSLLSFVLKSSLRTALFVFVFCFFACLLACCLSQEVGLGGLLVQLCLPPYASPHPHSSPNKHTSTHIHIHSHPHTHKKKIATMDQNSRKPAVFVCHEDEHEQQRAAVSRGQATLAFHTHQQQQQQYDRVAATWRQHDPYHQATHAPLTRQPLLSTTDDTNDNDSNSDSNASSSSQRGRATTLAPKADLDTDSDSQSMAFHKDARLSPAWSPSRTSVSPAREGILTTSRQGSVRRSTSRHSRPRSVHFATSASTSPVRGSSSYFAAPRHSHHFLHHAHTHFNSHHLDATRPRSHQGYRSSFHGTQSLNSSTEGRPTDPLQAFRDGDSFFSSFDTSLAAVPRRPRAKTPPPPLQHTHHQDESLPFHNRLLHNNHNHHHHQQLSERPSSAHVQSRRRSNSAIDAIDPASHAAPHSSSTITSTLLRHEATYRVEDEPSIITNMGPRRRSRRGSLDSSIPLLPPTSHPHAPDAPDAATLGQGNEQLPLWHHHHHHQEEEEQSQSGATGQEARPASSTPGPLPPALAGPGHHHLHTPHRNHSQQLSRSFDDASQLRSATRFHSSSSDSRRGVGRTSPRATAHPLDHSAHLAPNLLRAQSHESSRARPRRHSSVDLGLYRHQQGLGEAAPACSVAQPQLAGNTPKGNPRNRATGRSESGSGSSSNNRDHPDATWAERDDGAASNRDRSFSPALDEDYRVFKHQIRAIQRRFRLNELPYYHGWRRRAWVSKELLRPGIADGTFLVHFDIVDNQLMLLLSLCTPSYGAAHVPIELVQDQTVVIEHKQFGSISRAIAFFRQHPLRTVGSSSGDSSPARSPSPTPLASTQTQQTRQTRQTQQCDAPAPQRGGALSSTTTTTKSSSPPAYLKGFLPRPAPEPLSSADASPLARTGSPQAAATPPGRIQRSASYTTRAGVGTGEAVMGQRTSVRRVSSLRTDQHSREVGVASAPTTGPAPTAVESKRTRASAVKWLWDSKKRASQSTTGESTPNSSTEGLGDVGQPATVLTKSEAPALTDCSISTTL